MGQLDTRTHSARGTVATRHRGGTPQPNGVIVCKGRRGLIVEREYNLDVFSCLGTFHNLFPLSQIPLATEFAFRLEHGHLTEALALLENVFEVCTY